jgi:hypothetical protein
MGNKCQRKLRGLPKKKSPECGWSCVKVPSINISVSGLGLWLTNLLVNMGIAQLNMLAKVSTLSNILVDLLL